MTNKQLETKKLFPSPTLLTLPVEVQNRFLSYLDVTSIESLGRTCSHFDLLINGRFLTSLSLPLDHNFLQELTETNTLEKKPLLRLESNKPRESGNKEDDTWYGHFMAKFIDSKRSLKDYIIHSQMSLLSLSQVREIDLVAKGFRGEDLKNSTSMLECFQTLDRIILRQMSSLGHLANISRLDIMIVEDDFCQTLLKEFIPSLTNLLELGITIGERKNSLRDYFYGTLEDVVAVTKAPTLRLTVIGATKKNYPKVFRNDSIEKLIVSAPCTFSLFLLMKKLRDVRLEMTGPGDSGNCCTYQKSKADDRNLHRSGLCIVHLGSLYRNCPDLQTFDGVEIGKISQERLSFPKWNAKVKKLFYEEYVKAGGDKELKSWSSSRWFSKKPVVPTVFGKYRYPEPCLLM